MLILTNYLTNPFPFKVLKQLIATHISNSFYLVRKGYFFFLQLSKISWTGRILICQDCATILGPVKGRVATVNKGDPRNLIKALEQRQIYRRKLYLLK